MTTDGTRSLVRSLRTIGGSGEKRNVNNTRNYQDGEFIPFTTTVTMNCLFVLLRTPETGQMGRSFYGYGRKIRI